MSKEYIHFELVEEKPKTNVYAVLTNKLVIESGVTPHHEVLGEIRWSPTWRQYIFVPESETDWSLGCLTQVTDFLSLVNKSKKYVPPPFEVETKRITIKCFTRNNGGPIRIGRKLD
jgi:hypothetical protein